MDTSEEVLRYLLDGASVDLVGRAGSGRSEVARRVAAALEWEERPVLRFRGVRSQRERALGVAILGNKNLNLGNYGTVREFSAALAHELRPGAVIVIDDADDLDPATAGVIGSLHATTEVPVLATRRMPFEPSGTLQDLVSSLHPGVRIALAPLPFDEIRRLVHDLLGSRVEPLTVARIATKSGGLPGLVQAMVIVGRRKGVITKVDDVWTAVAPLWMPELSHTVGAMLAHACEDDLDRLAELAERGVTDLDTAALVVRSDRLAHLLRAGFVELLETAAGCQVSVFPPLLGEYLTREYTTSRRLENAPAGRVLTPGALDVHRRALSSEDSLLSRVFAEQSVHRTARLLTAWEADPTPAAAIPLLTSMLVLGTPGDEIEGIYRRTDARAGTSTERAEFVGWYAVYRAVVEGTTDVASEILDAARAELPDESGYLDAVEAHLRFVLDRVPDVSCPTTRDHARLESEATVGVAIETALARGRAQTARELMQGFDPRYATFHSHRSMCLGLALVLEGRLREGVEWALERLQDALRDHDAGAAIAQSYVAGLGLALTGRFREMNEVLSSALTISTVALLQAYMHSGVLITSALGALWQGRIEYARSLAHDAQTLWRRPGPYPAMHAGEVLALTTAHDDLSTLWATVIDRFDKGYVAAGVFMAVEVAERARTGMSEHRIRERAANAEGPLLEAMLKYAEALCARDLGGLDHAARQFESIGAHLYVVRSLVARALLLREAGDLLDAIAEVDSAWEVAQGFEASVAGLFSSYVVALDISAREMEVIQLLAAGLTTNDIATALTVSARTVENHVFSVYRKVGVDSRSALRRIASTWLKPVPTAGASHEPSGHYPVETARRFRRDSLDPW